jgi:hypothetical protein
MKIIFEVKTSANLTEQQIKEEILLTETRMNAGGKLRFHLVKIDESKKSVIKIYGEEPDEV